MSTAKARYPRKGPRPPRARVARLWRYWSSSRYRAISSERGWAADDSRYSTAPTSGADPQGRAAHDTVLELVKVRRRDPGRPSHRSERRAQFVPCIPQCLSKFSQYAVTCPDSSDQPLVPVHGMQQRLIESGLVVVGNEQQPVLIGRKPFRQPTFLDLLRVRVDVHAGLGVPHAGVWILDRAGQRHQHPDVGVAPVWTAAAIQPCFRRACHLWLVQALGLPADRRARSA